MKKLLFGLIATVMFSFVGNAQTFEQSVTIITKDRVPLISASKTLSARSVQLISNNTVFKLPTTIVISNVKLTDDGKGNDLKAGDGIYTSIDGFAPPKGGFKSYDITFDGNVNPAGIDKSNGHIRVKCHIAYYMDIPYVSCDVDIDINW